jgi:hypothetical protein
LVGRDKHGGRAASMTYPSGKVLSYKHGTSNGPNELVDRLEFPAEFV